MTRCEKWQTTFDLLQDLDIEHDGDSLDELTEYLHQVGLRGEEVTFLDVLKDFNVRSARSSIENIANTVKMVYEEEMEE